MKYRSVIMSAFGIGAMLAIGGAAQAADIHINIYGASAQHLFWNDAADNFLSAQGCSNVAQASLDSKNGITKGTCGGDTVYIRYSSKASFDGILAQKGDDSYATTAEKCNAGDPTIDGGTVPADRVGHFRKLIDQNSCNWSTGSCSASKCGDITLGASDVAGSSFTQATSGNLLGPLGGALTTRSFSGINTDGLTPYNPLVVPFAFFVNTSVTKDGQTLDNISRVQAVMAFGGQARSWGDFGTNFGVTGDSSKRLVLCMRHAGSGTQATLDHGVMNGLGWGGIINGAQKTGGTPRRYFNDGSSDLMKCVNGDGTWNGLGAIGMADADQSLSSYPNTKKLKYNGEEASRVNIRNGLYEFWSVQWLYENPSDPSFGATNPWVTALMEYASKPANIPSTKAAYWASKDEMKFLKPSDRQYPVYDGCGTDCQTP